MAWGVATLPRTRCRQWGEVLVKGIDDGLNMTFVGDDGGDGAENDKTKY